MEYIFSGGDLSNKDIAACIGKHAGDAARIVGNYAYYESKVFVHKLQPVDGTADNRVNANLAKYIADVATGYFVGVPPQYVSEDARLHELQQIFDRNDESTINYEIAENMSIAGVGYDVVYVDERKDIRIAAVDPRTAFLIVDDSIERRVLAGVRYWAVEGGKRRGEIYLPKLTRVFEQDGGTLRIVQEIPTPFASVPMTQYKNNRHGIGDFEPVKTLIDAYNKTLCNVSDDLENTAAAYLVVTGFEQMDEDDRETLRRMRILSMPQDGKMEYVVKNLNDGVIENHKRTLRREILQIAGVPDLSDENFAGSASGVALRYKLWGIDQLFAKKRAQMDKGLFRRMGLIGDALRILKKIEIGDVRMSVSVKFVQNMPKDKTVDIEDAVKVSGVVSEQTVHEMLAPVTGVSAEDEAQRMEQEAEGGDYADIVDATVAEAEAVELPAETPKPKTTRARSAKK